MINFCTLFDSNYSAKGLAMYRSLVHCCPSFHLYIFAFDDALVEIMNRLKLEKVTVIPLREFEDEELLRVKPTRTAGEYCWTCGGSTILYCLTHFNIDSCTYIDADLYFFQNPSCLIDEMGDKDVLITEHRYTHSRDLLEQSGKYCVQFMTFKNNTNALSVLRWWRNACIEWCYDRYEDGKFGDQKYLDDWTSRFHGIHVLRNLGGGVAPWNVEQYTFRKSKNTIVGTCIAENTDFDIVFYHFHALQSYSAGILRHFMACHYPLSYTSLRLIYSPYIKELKRCYKIISKCDRGVNSLMTKSTNEYHNLWGWIKSIYTHLFRERDIRYFYWISR